MFDINDDMMVADGIAKMFAPMKTGNLRFNAIKSERMNFGFRVRYSLADAFYIYFIEEGTSRKGGAKHIGFISNNTVPAIANYLFTKYEAKKRNQTNKIKRLSRNAQIDNKFESKTRAKRHAGSLNFDLETVAREQDWKHNTDNEVFDTNWKRGDFFWLVKHLDQA